MENLRRVELKNNLFPKRDIVYLSHSFNSECRVLFGHDSWRIYLPFPDMRKDIQNMNSIWAFINSVRNHELTSGSLLITTAWKI